MLVIAVLRHADYLQPKDVPSAWLPWPISKQGVEQAKGAAAAIGRFLDKHSLVCMDVIDSSLMLRAWQTATIIAEQLQDQSGRTFSVAQFEALAERGVGAAANLTLEQIEQILHQDPRYEAPPSGWKSMSAYKLPFQGAESLNEAGIRVARHIESVWQACTAAGEAGVKVIVGHGAAIRHAARHMGVLSAEQVGRVSMYHAVPMFFTRDSEGWRIIDGEWKPRASHEEAGDEFSAG